MASASELQEQAARHRRRGVGGCAGSLNIAERDFAAWCCGRPKRHSAPEPIWPQAVPVLLAGDFVSFENSRRQIPANHRRAALFGHSRGGGGARAGAGRWLRVFDALRPGGGGAGKLHRLVEVGVGLIPAGGGCKEFALRAMDEAKGGDLLPFPAPYFEAMAMAKVSRSAEEAKQLGYLKPSDVIVFNPHELLYVAKRKSGHWRKPAIGRRNRARSGWRDAPVWPLVRWRWSTCAMAVSFRPRLSAWA
jgi:hypothetical protein